MTVQNSLLLKAKNETGVSLIEIVIAIALFAIIIGASIPMYRNVYTKNDLDTNVSKLLKTIRLTQSRAMNGEGNDKYGLYLDMSSVPNKYVVFKGSSYDPNNAANESYDLSTHITFSNIDLNNGGQELIFEKYSGNTDKYGTIMLKDPSGEELTIVVNEIGSTDVQ